MSLKILFSAISTLILVAVYIPYFKDIFLLRTKPHAYTWLIWLITVGTALVGILRGGGGWGASSLVVGFFLVGGVFLFSLKYGTKNITKGDTIILIAAFSAVLVWWQLNKPLLAVVMVSVIDVLGYIPSYRKSYEEPWSETLISWIGFVVSNIFALLALNEYNLLTTTYLIAITFANLALFLLCFLRRPFVPRPK